MESRHSRDVSYEDAETARNLTPLAQATIAEGRRITLGRLIIWAALSAAVLAGGLYAGLQLRRRRLSSPHNPYQVYDSYNGDEGGEYETVGI